jgi:hypothetical protein
MRPLLTHEGILVEREVVRRSLNGESAADLLGVRSEEGAVHLSNCRFARRR